MFRTKWPYHPLALSIMIFIRIECSFAKDETLRIINSLKRRAVAELVLGVISIVANINRVVLIKKGFLNIFNTVKMSHILSKYQSVYELCFIELETKNELVILIFKLILSCLKTTFLR